jgi:hypothetical protein
MKKVASSLDISEIYNRVFGKQGIIIKKIGRVR